MKFATSLMTLAATTAILGTTTITASAATSQSETIQALPNQTETKAAHDALANDTSSDTTSVTATTADTSSTVTSGNQTATTSRAKAVVALAKQLANESIPYVWGGESLSGMDCSGLTDYVYQHAANISLGHYTVTQEGKVTKKTVAQAEPGDLLFWGSEGATYHVAIYIGNNQFVAAPQPGQNVEVETINSAFMPSFAGTVK